MAKGKFESGKGGSSGGRDPYAVKDKPSQTAARSGIGSKLWPILAAVAGVAVLVVGILLLTKHNRPAAPETTGTTAVTLPLEGMPRAELEKRFGELDSLIRQDLTLTLTPEPVDPTRTEEPLTLTLTQAQSGAGLDLAKLAADLDNGVGQERGDSYLLDPRDYLTLDDLSLRQALDRFVEEYGTAYAEATADLEPGAEDDQEKILVLHTGVVGRSLDADQLFDTVKEALETALVAEDPAEALQPQLSYKFEQPQELDVDALYERYCKDPQEPELDPETGKVKEGRDGYGFDKEELIARLAEAAPGQELRVTLNILEPEMDAETLRESLFKDVLAEVHTNHTNIYNRTTNLKLACEAIDGTILLPGDTFSFNKVVGERTAEKGYKEAIAYVSGGESKPEVGGGVCQVASSIYYAVLQADLKVVEREPHMFLVDYVPSGMDTTIYWGYLDFKFENDSPYPIKIESSVSNGQVHITLLGTEWKDYTVELTYEVLDTEAWTTVEREVANDGTYRNGEVITTPYTGYKIATYKTTRDKDGKKLETTQIAISRYNKRDKVVAKVTGPYVRPTQPTQPTPTQPKPTQPTPTQPKPTQPTPTQPKPTEPAPTQPKPTEPAPTEPAPTEPAPTQPAPTEPAPTQPAPTEPAPTQPAPTEPAPTEPAPADSEG